MTPAMWLAAGLIGLGWLAGKRYPIIGGAFFAVALLALFWAPGGLVS